VFVSVRNGFAPRATISSTILRMYMGRMKAVFPFSPKWSFTAVKAPFGIRPAIPAARRRAPVLSRRPFPGRDDMSVIHTADGAPGAAMATSR